MGLYVFRGSGLFGADQTPVEEHKMAVFEPSHGPVRVSGSSDHSMTEILLMAGKPLVEPVARHGPFVMNSQAEILEAIEDFEAGRMGKVAATGTA